MMTGQELVIIQIIGNIAWIVARTVAFFWLWNCFVPIEKRNNKISKEYSIFFCCLIAIELLQWFFKTDGIPFMELLWTIVPLVYTVIRRKEASKETVFVLFLYLNCRYLSYFIVGSITDILSHKVMAGVVDATNIDWFLSIRINAMYMVNYILYIILLMMAILPVAKFTQKSEKMSWYECGYLSVMNVAGIVLTRIMMGIILLTGDKGAFILMEEKPELVWELPMVAVLLYLGELSAIYIWQKYRVFRQHSELYFLENMEKEAIRKRLEDTEKYYDQIRKVRHEMASHMTNIKGLAERGCMDELSKYISDMDATIQSVDMKYVTGNPVTDVVLNDRAGKAEEKGITYTLSFSFDEAWGIPVYDLSIVLCNILDNAIKAAEGADGELRYVDLKVMDKGTVILIQCENGFGSETGANEQSDSTWHGFGLKNVEEIANRHYGTVNLKKEENRCKITVMLKKNDLL